MIKSVNDIGSSGDAIEFVEDNLVNLERIENVALQFEYPTDNLYECAALILEGLVKLLDEQRESEERVIWQVESGKFDE